MWEYTGMAINKYAVVFINNSLCFTHKIVVLVSSASSSWYVLNKQLLN